MSETIFGWPSDQLGTTKHRRATRPTVSSGTAQQRRGILIADDLALVLTLLRLELEVYNCSAFLARDGWEAIELYERHQESIDLILLNAHLPGLQSKETIAKLRRINPDVRFCFMARYGKAHHKTERPVQRPRVTFEMPFDPATVAQTLSEILDTCETRTERGRSQQLPRGS